MVALATFPVVLPEEYSVLVGVQLVELLEPEAPGSFVPVVALSPAVALATGAVGLL